MEVIVGWLSENREWVFSGVGVSVISLVLGFWFGRASVRSSFKQEQRGGDHSTNTQIGSNTHDRKK